MSKIDPSDAQYVTGYLIREAGGESLHPTVKAHCDRILSRATAAEYRDILRHVPRSGIGEQCEIDPVQLTGQTEIGGV